MCYVEQGASSARRGEVKGSRTGNSVNLTHDL